GIVCMRVYPSRNMPLGGSKAPWEIRFHRAPWLRQALIQLGLGYHHKASGERSPAESAFLLLKAEDRSILQQHNKT
ncbi:MAG: hypothetical protein N3E47_05400, partial [Candidatus Bathyarchaeota archaeon]|nr:hypothetical protein [Candidatus Bathyarchaeota archaeon]